MKKIFSLFMIFLVLAGLFPAGAFCAPAQVIIIRHGEKPSSGNELSDQGRQRALALVGFFRNNPAVTKFGTPMEIYAMAPKGPDGSLRAIETVTPLARDLSLTINENFQKDDISGLVADIMHKPNYKGKMVLICWEHKIIPTIPTAFGWTSGPESWPGSEVYDRAWIMNFTDDKVTSFQDLPQHLLPGDSSR
ncbi:MAG: histidine phosphatase family protein [Candidatus Riflebacteria bacterium]|nr:histidine phosphatase family protein [Candidatus Riflebacteria bacterium]